MRNTGLVLSPGATRDRLAGVLGTAFVRGLVSEQTLTHRLGVLFGQRLVDPHGVIGDLSMRTHRRRWRWPPLAATVVAACRRVVAPLDRAGVAPLVLALNWTRGEGDLVIGRGLGCDIALSNDSVSRQHARLVFRDGAWIIQDLGSTNGTIVNGELVGRCQLQPGDRLLLGDQPLDVD
jgi:hypothetical protein